MADETQMDQGSAVPPQTGEKAVRGVSHAREAAGDVRSAAGTTGSSSAEEVARLAELRDKGVISDAEFQQAKAKALS